MTRNNKNMGAPEVYSDAAIVAAYKEHGTIRQAAKSLGCHDGTVSNRLILLGLYQRKPRQKANVKPTHSEIVKAARNSNPARAKEHNQKWGFKRRLGISYKDAPMELFELYCIRSKLYNELRVTNNE